MARNNQRTTLASSRGTDYVEQVAEIITVSFKMASFNVLLVLLFLISNVSCESTPCTENSSRSSYDNETRHNTSLRSCSRSTRPNNSSEDSASRPTSRCTRPCRMIQSRDSTNSQTLSWSTHLWGPSWVHSSASMVALHISSGVLSPCAE